MINSRHNKNTKMKAGHYEIHGETIAKFEFFDHGYNPYSRYLDVDKVDLILRKRNNKQIRYIDVQVKFGKLYECGLKWEKNLFDFTSWRFFKPEEFSESHDSLYIAYVMVPEDGYKGDIFIFPGKKFNELIKQAIISNTKKGKKLKVYIAHSIVNNKWYIWRKTNFKDLSNSNVVDVTKYWRNFKIIK